MQITDCANNVEGIKLNRNLYIGGNRKKGLSTTALDQAWVGVLYLDQRPSIASELSNSQSDQYGATRW
jgi:hypothetical protein